MNKRISIIGLGNVLRQDDAFGPEVIRVLEARYSFPESVDIADLGTPGIALTPYIAGYDALIVIDSAEADLEPGSLVRYEKEDIIAASSAQTTPRMSPHEPGLSDSLWLTDMMGDCPEDVVLVGAVPQDLDQGVGLSATMRSAVEPVADAVAAELARLGCEIQRRDTVAAGDTWWS